MPSRRVAKSPDPASLVWRKDEHPPVPRPRSTQRSGGIIIRDSYRQDIVITAVACIASFTLWAIKTTLAQLLTGNEFELAPRVAWKLMMIQALVYLHVPWLTYWLTSQVNTSLLGSETRKRQYEGVCLVGDPLADWATYLPVHGDAEPIYAVSCRAAFVIVQIVLCVLEVRSPSLLHPLAFVASCWRTNGHALMKMQLGSFVEWQIFLHAAFVMLMLQYGAKWLRWAAERRNEVAADKILGNSKEKITSIFNFYLVPTAISTLSVGWLHLAIGFTAISHTHTGPNQSRCHFMLRDPFWSNISHPQHLIHQGLRPSWARAPPQLMF